MQHVATIYCHCGHTGEQGDTNIVERMMSELYRPHLKCSACGMSGREYELRFSFDMARDARFVAS